MKTSTLVLRDYKNWLLRSFSLILGLLILPSLYAQAATCPAGYTSASFSAGDYTQFGTISGGTSSSSRSIMGGTNNLTASITSNGNSQSIQGTPDTGTGFQINQVMPNGSAVNTTTFKFTNAIKGLKVNLYDIDRIHVGKSFGDKVTIKAKVASGNVIDPTKLTYGVSDYSITSNTIETSTGPVFRTDDCDGHKLSTLSNCLGIATF